MKKIIYIFIVLIFITINLHAQWGNQIGENVQLTNGDGIKYNVLIEPAPEGSWYISYTAVSAPNKNVVHLARVDSIGNILWDNIIHDLSEVGLPDAQMISDEAGGVIMAWNDRRVSSDVLVYANRIAPDGTKMWGENDIPVGVSEGSENCPKLISDGNNGIIITINDQNPPPGNFTGIYAYRVNFEGNVLWRTFLFPGGDCFSYDVSSDEQGGLFAFHHYGHFFDQENQLRGMRLDGNGNKIWTDETIEIGGFSLPIGKKFYGSADGLSHPNIKFHPLAGLYVIHYENPFGGGPKKHRGHLIDLDANELWNDDGLILNNPSDNSPDTKGVVDSEGSLYFNYHTDEEWAVQKVLADGSLPWTIEGVPYSNAFQGTSDKLVMTSCDDVMTAFDGINDVINISRISSDGDLVYPSEMLTISVDQIGDQHRDPVLGINNEDRVIAVWADDENVNDSDWNLKMHGFHKNGMLGNATNILEIENFNLSIFPNPINKNETIQIKAFNLNFGNILLYNLEGKLLKEKKGVNFQNEIVNFKLPKELNHGIYLLKVISEEKVLTKKIIIE